MQQEFADAIKKKGKEIKMKHKIFTTILLVSFLFSFHTAKAESKGKEKARISLNISPKWEKVIEAISKVESGGNSNAVSNDGASVGFLQITKVLVDECNTIMNRVNGTKGKKYYRYSDRMNIKKSKEMFIIIQQTYCSNGDVSNMIRIWNGGINGYNKSSAYRYLSRVREKM